MNPEVLQTIEKDKIFILIASMYSKEIAQQLVSYGFENKKHFGDESDDLLDYTGKKLIRVYIENADGNCLNNMQIFAPFPEDNNKSAIESIKEINFNVRKLASLTHKYQFDLQWKYNKVPTEWFDHYLDVYYQWSLIGNPQFVERGIFNLLAIRPEANILELCCGDGFNAKYFYSIRAKHILAVDFDLNAISQAAKYNSKDNIIYRQADIRNEMPEGVFDNIIWDAAIEHFTEEEIDSLLKDIKLRLHANGVLSGYTIVERPQGKQFLLHDYEFKSKEDLYRFFTPYFKNIRVLETVYPSRHNLYFWASDGTIPFDDNWEAMISKK